MSDHIISLEMRHSFAQILTWKCLGFVRRSESTNHYSLRAAAAPQLSSAYIANALQVAAAGGIGRSVGKAGRGREREREINAFSKLEWLSHSGQAAAAAE